MLKGLKNDLILLYRLKRPRPMVISAVAGAFTVLLFFKFRSLSLIITLLLLTLLTFLIIIKFDFSFVLSVLMVFLISVSILNVYKIVDKIHSLSGETISLSLVAQSDAVFYGNKGTVTVSVYTPSVIPKGTKLKLSYYYPQNINMGDIFKADVLIDSRRNNSSKTYNYSTGVYGTCKMKKYLKDCGTDPFLSKIRSIRTYISNTVFYNLPYDDAALLNALTVGDKTFLDDNFLTDVKTSGVSHVMAVSGLHLSIMLGALFYLLDRIFYNRFFRAGFALFTVLIFSAICGFTMSVTRAGFMFLITAFAPIFNRDSDSLNSLGGAVTLILIGTPFAIFNIGFELSVLATYGILVIAPEISDIIISKFSIPEGFVSGIISVLIITVSASVMTLPVIAMNYEYISLAAPLTNILISFAVEVVLLLNAAALFLNLIPGLNFFTRFMYFISGFLLKYIRFVIKYISLLPFASVRVEKISAILFTVFLIILLLVIYACKMHRFLIKYKSTIEMEDEQCRRYLKKFLQKK